MKDLPVILRIPLFNCSGALPVSVCASPAFLRGLVAVCLLLAACGSAHAITELRTVAQEGTEPKFVATKQGGVAGLCIDIMRAIERVEPSIKFVGDQTWMPLVRVEAEMASGDQDAAFCLVRSKDRETKFTYIEPPLYSIDFVLAVRADDRIDVRSWNDIRKLENNTVLVMRSSGSINRVEESGGGIVFDSAAKTPEQNLHKLRAGRARFFYHRTPGLTGEIRRAGLEDQIRILPVVMDATESYLILGRHVPPEVVSKVQRAVATLQKMGELTRLRKKWDRE